MPPARRADIVRIAEKFEFPIIEDSVYGFLADETPLSALAPESCILLDSLSKKVAPGLALGFIVAPLRLRESIMASVRSGGWTAAGYAFAAGQRLMGDGTAAELVLGVDPLRWLHSPQNGKATDGQEPSGHQGSSYRFAEEFGRR